MTPETPKPDKLPKVLTVANIINQRINRIAFAGDWYEAFKQPQDKGVWLVWGGSGSGKSSFVMQLCKAFASLEHRVFLNLLEEETDDSDFIERVQMHNMQEVTENFSARSFNYEQMVQYLSRKTSANIKVVVIDSGIYFFKDYDQYQQFKRKFRNKIIIITAHASGKNPKHALEDSIMYDAKMKIYVNGYLATCKGRTIGPNGGNFIVWQYGYDKLHGQLHK